MSSLFEGIDMKELKLSELNGKTIRVMVYKDEEGGMIVGGYDIDNGHCYILSMGRWK